jgi:hypothetical protein
MTLGRESFVCSGHTQTEGGLLFLRLLLQKPSFISIQGSSMNSTTKQIIVRPTSNDDVREYHVTGVKITDQPYAEFFSPLYGSDKDFEHLGEQGQELADSLMDKANEKMISRVTFRPNSVRVYKSPTADWTTVEKNIVIPALQKTFGTEFKPIQYGSTKFRELAFA